MEKDKYFNRLEKEISVISVVNNLQLQPYLELFQYVPENVFHQSLGTLLGFFKINDTSEDSAYIVNFLSSVVKKEFYANTKRAVSESVDASLRKINLALAELARQGNINWLGKLDGAVCVFEKNSLHFSVCGKAKILLVRNGSISEISADLATEEAESNPLKTFENVSSGRLELNDKLIIATDDMLRVFSFTELKKASLRFQRGKFSQFIKTALVNQLDVAGVIIVDVFEKKEFQPEMAKKKDKLTEESSVNVFSEKVFIQATKDRERAKTIAIRETSEQKEYTDEKTGHIYVRGEYDQKGGHGKIGLYLFIFKEKIFSLFQSLKSNLKRNTLLLLHKTKKLFSKKPKPESPAIIPQPQPVQIQTAGGEVPKTRRFSFQFLWIKKIVAFLKNAFQKIRLPKKAASAPFPERYSPESVPFPSEKPADLQNIKPEISQSVFKIFPNFSKIRALFGKLSYKQKIYSLLIIVAIIVVPLIIIQVQKKNANLSSQQTAQENPNDPRIILASEKNIHFIDNVRLLTAIENSKYLISLNDNIFAITNSALAQWKDDALKENQWPREFGNISLVAGMKDLNLILIFTDQNKVVSFSPVSSQFKENNIQIPEGARVSAIATYLTYLYVLDAQNNQLYRYPRAEGGFGNKADWLKESVDLSNVSAMMIDENVYLAENNGVIKLFKGKKQELNLESTSVPVKIDGLYTNSDTQNIYILDKENGRVLQFNKNGALLAQYQNSDLQGATGFAVNEKNNIVYFITSEKLESFNLQ